MSVTFSITSTESDPILYTTRCFAYGSVADFRSAQTHTTREAAFAAHNAAHVGHPDCDGYDLTCVSRVYPFEEYDLNMANGNAEHVLYLLGYDTEDLCGSDTAEGLLGRVLTAIALSPADEGVPATVTAGNGPTIVDCGRPAGYTDERLSQLRDLAERAMSAGRTITWG